MKQKPKIKARRMWVADDCETICETRGEAICISRDKADVMPVAVLGVSEPAAIIEQLAEFDVRQTFPECKKLPWKDCPADVKKLARDHARAMLENLGILKKRRVKQ